MEIFEGDDSTKEDGSFLCNSEFGLNCGVASDKGICMPWVCVCIDSWYTVGDAADGECVESDDIFIPGLLILSLFKRRESLSLLGLLSNDSFFNNLSALSCRRSLVMSLKIGVFITSLCIALIFARLPSLRILIIA